MGDRFPRSLGEKFANASFWTLTERPRVGARCPLSEAKGATKFWYSLLFDSFDSSPGADTRKTTRYILKQKYFRNSKIIISCVPRMFSEVLLRLARRHGVRACVRCGCMAKCPMGIAHGSSRARGADYRYLEVNCQVLVSTAVY